MSTRSTTHFVHGSEKPHAIIYRHGDGYPEGAGIDIRRFLEECSQLKDTRFGDPSYLAAKYVVFLADMFNHNWEFDDNNKMIEVKPKSRLEFISVGVQMTDPMDIEYRYVIDCGRIVNGLPTVTCYEVDFDFDSGEEKKKEEVEIPPIPQTVKN